MTILWYIHVDINRFSLLKSRIPDITPKMLAQQLRELEGDGLIVRVVQSERPLHVEYSLTTSGCTLLPILDALNTWAVHDRGLASNINANRCSSSHYTDKLVDSEC